MVVDLDEFLPAGIVESYKAGAVARGVSFADYIRESPIQNAPMDSLQATLIGDAWEKAFDEFFDSIPLVGPLPDDAFSRENIYGREDNW